MTKDEALKLALEALEDWNGSFYDNCPDEELIASIQEILTQPEQEPVAWLNEEKKIIYWHNTHETDDYHGFKRTTPLYTSPPQRKPLSEEEIGAILEDVNAYGTRLYTFARAIEAAHGIKV